MIIDRWQRNALKGQFISAQGNALGVKRGTTPRAPCKGSLKNTVKTWTTIGCKNINT